LVPASLNDITCVSQYLRVSVFGTASGALRRRAELVREHAGTGVIGDAAQDGIVHPVTPVDEPFGVR